MNADKESEKIIFQPETRNPKLLFLVDPQILLNPDLLRAQYLGKKGFPLQRRPLGTAKNVQACGLKFGERVDGQVGLLQKPKAGHSSRIRKPVPDGISDGV